MSELPAVVAAAPGGDRGGQAGRLGLGLRTLTPEVAARLGLDREVKGVVVTAVRPGSPAAEAGLRQGDVIVGVDRRPVTSAAQAVGALGKRRPEGHLARVRRGDASFFVAIPSPPED